VKGLPGWPGPRGEGFVAAQVVLLALIAFGPRGSRTPALPGPVAAAATLAGAALMAAGGVLLVASLIRLGPNLTPLPYPKAGSVLVRTGPYRLVRHPIYAAVLALAFGWALWVHGAWALLYAFALLALLDRKATREERWLCEKFPEYPAYQRRVGKLVPFIR